MKFCFLSLQNVKLLIHQWKYWKFPEYMCCFHGWNLKILLYSQKLWFYDNFLTFGICFSYPFSLTIQFLPLLLLSQSKRKMFSEYEFYNQFTLSHAPSFENRIIFSFKKTIYYRRLLLMLTFTSDLRTISLNSSILISSSWSSDVLLPSEAFKDKNTYKAQKHTKRGHSWMSED